MTAYDDQLAEYARTPQSLVKIGVRYCANFYAQTFDQEFNLTDQIGTPVYFGLGGTANFVLNAVAAPDGTVTASQILLPANGDFLRTGTEDGVAASHAFTDSIWLYAAAPGTVTLDMTDSTASEITSVVVSITTGWQRFIMHRLYTAGATGAHRMRVRRQAGDLAAVYAWGINGSRNPGDQDADLPFPYIRRALAVIDNTVRASRCQAVDAVDGARCYYSFPTCQDPANFNAGNTYEATLDLQGLREYKFCDTNGPLPFPDQEVRPYIRSTTWAAQKIDAQKSVTHSDRAEIVLNDDARPGLWDPAKSLLGAKVNTALEQGTFWRRWIAIFRNYPNPACYAHIYRGFIGGGVTESLYAQRGDYLMTDARLGADGALTLVCADRLKLLSLKAPPKISLSNVLTVAAAGGDATIAVASASEFSAPPTDGSFIVTIQIDAEKMNVTGRDVTGNILTVQRGRWGTTAAAHSKNAAIIEIMEFGTEMATPSLVPLGKNPIDIAIEIHRRAGLTAAQINSAQLLDERDTWLPSTVDTTTGATSGTLFRRTVTDQTDLETLITEIREVTILFLWTGEDGIISGRLFAPARPTVTLTEITDDADIVADSLEIDDQDEGDTTNTGRVTRVLVAWDLIAGKTGDQVADYNKGVAVIEPSLEATEGYGQQRLMTILSKWIQPGDSATPASAGQHLMDRFRLGARLYKMTLERRRDDVKIGDFVLLTSSSVQLGTGATQSRQLQVVSKEPTEDGLIRLECLDTNIFKRYFFWAPDGLPDYDAATTDQQRYGYWSDDQGLVGTAKVAGYSWW